MKAGDTFRFVNKADKHIRVIISDPDIDPENVLIVHWTTHDRLKDQSCILQANDHERIRHKSCVEYSRARVASRHALQRIRDDGRLEMLEPVSDDLLDYIRTCVVGSSLPNEYVQILIAQGLIEP